jgi:competence protein ComEC
LKKCLVPFLILLLFACSIFSACGLQESSLNKDNIMKVHFIDVGQGDSILIQVNGINMLIDAGPAENSEDLISYLKKQKIRKLHYIVATHPHEDHIGGMSAVIRKFDVGEFYAPKIIAETRYFEDMTVSLKEKGLMITPARKGTFLYLGQKTECEMLSPCSESYDNLNNYSSVILIIYGSSSFLFTGDAEELAETEIIGTGADIDCDVLKAGHHGSSTSSSKQLLEATTPDTAVISAGRRNDYGHPSKTVLSALEKIDAQIYRTDIDGTIILESDGKMITKD